MTYNCSDSPIIPFLRVLVLHDSPIFPIIRFFRLLFSDFCDSPRSTRFSDFSDHTILPILLVLHDSPIFPIIRFFRLLFSDFCDSPRSTRFSDFSDCPPILPIFRLDDSSNYSTNLLRINELEPLKLLFYSMTTYITL